MYIRSLIVNALRSVKRVVLRIALRGSQSRFVGNGLRRKVLQLAGIKVGRNVTVGSGVGFANTNVSLGDGARIGRGASFHGVARVAVEACSFVAPGRRISTTTLIGPSRLELDQVVVIGSEK